MVTDRTGRTRIPQLEGQEPAPGGQRRVRPRVESGTVPRDPARPSDPIAVGNAMKALFESSNVSIRRGDETRVVNRSLPPSQPPPAPTPSTRPPAGPPTHSSAPAPRVDLWLWVVMATGLFAIAGWMVAYALQ